MDSWFYDGLLFTHYKSPSSSLTLLPNVRDADSISSIAAQHAVGNLYAVTRNKPLRSGKVQYWIS
jgi:hypothetical protein